MHIKLLNKKIFFNDYNVKCSIGKRGISNKKREGDYCTPKGTFKFKALLYRKDRIPMINSNIKKIIIRKNMGWCDDIKSKFYNKLIHFPFNFSAEELYLKNNTYDLLLIINYNLNPVIKNKGSAIFLHIAKKNYSPTKGCIAVSKIHMRYIIKNITKKSKITIY